MFSLLQWQHGIVVSFKWKISWNKYVCVFKNRYRTFVSEDAGPNTLVATVLAKDPDGDGITYKITAGNGEGNFVIDSQKGETSISDLVLLFWSLRWPFYASWAFTKEQWRLNSVVLFKLLTLHCIMLYISHLTINDTLIVIYKYMYFHGWMIMAGQLFK